MKVVCRTSLDLENERWPDELSAVPSVGDYIESSTVHRNGFRLELKVVRVTWKNITLYNHYDGKEEKKYIPHIELHMTDYHARLIPDEDRFPDACQGSITAFYCWYAPNVGRSVGAFI